MDFNIFLNFFKNIVDDNTRMDEWVYSIIVENIYHDEVKDFPMLWKKDNYGKIRSHLHSQLFNLQPSQQ